MVAVAGGRWAETGAAGPGSVKTARFAGRKTRGEEETGDWGIAVERGRWMMGMGMGFSQEKRC